METKRVWFNSPNNKVSQCQHKVSKFIWFQTAILLFPLHHLCPLLGAWTLSKAGSCSRDSVTEESGMSSYAFNVSFKSSIFQSEWSHRMKRENWSNIAVENSALWQSLAIYLHSVLCYLYTDWNMAAYSHRKLGCYTELQKWLASCQEKFTSINSWSVSNMA